MFQLRNLESVTPLQLGELVLIGRGDACDVRLDDPSASRVHCRLLARDGKVFLTDAGSRWGRIVAGRRVADCELRPGDEITIGETVLLLEATGTPAATTLARHPHLVTLLDASAESERCYPVSEFVEGESAAALIQRIGIVGMLDWRTTLRIGRDICAALVFASEQGIVHRHITPQNILIRKSDGAALLNDLLLARSLNDDAAGRLTQAGEVLGTIPFLSPEQVGSSHPMDYRSDLYQLGATLYALLTGRTPADSRNVANVVQRILTDAPQPPSRTHLAIPALLEGVILRLLEKRPDDRYASPITLQQELNRVNKYLGEPHSSL